MRVPRLVASMFGVSGPELIVVAIIALLVFGPDKLPELARTAGKLAGQFRRQSDAIRREFYNTVYRPASDFQTRINLETRALRTLADTSPASATKAAAPAGDTDRAAPTADSSASTAPASDASTQSAAANPDSSTGGSKPHNVGDEKLRDPQ